VKKNSVDKKSRKHSAKQKKNNVKRNELLEKRRQRKIVKNSNAKNKKPNRNKRLQLYVIDLYEIVLKIM
jgi:hypothetical protein